MNYNIIIYLLYKFSALKQMSLRSFWGFVKWHKNILGINFLYHIGDLQLILSIMLYASIDVG